MTNESSTSVTRRRFAQASFGTGARLLLSGACKGFSHEVSSSPARPASIKSVVLTHGAFADGSSWSKVIPSLEAEGLNVTAVQNPLTSLAEDVTTTRRILAQQNGATILVGHSYAGFVITEAGNAPNVAGLVYVSSYGPDQGESHDDLVKRFPVPAGISAIRTDEYGFLWIARDKFHEAFMHDAEESYARILATVQKPAAKKGCFGVPVSAPAWKSKRSWFLVSTDDYLINPDLQRFMAKRMDATVRTVPSSHASLISHPQRSPTSFLRQSAMRFERNKRRSNNSDWQSLQTTRFNRRGGLWMTRLEGPLPLDHARFRAVGSCFPP
ncbi:MAG TPA: alpha/beta hydrolase [Bryobacteraceae bacterium]|jgi:pimeloyl-ACP methyl ester carboxylesterase|nr:alpha/beta hydrolase [Bryobacteraceae bacterium]